MYSQNTRELSVSAIIGCFNYLLGFFLCGCVHQRESRLTDVCVQHCTWIYINAVPFGRFRSFFTICHYADEQLFYYCGVVCKYVYVTLLRPLPARKTDIDMQNIQ